MSRENLPSGFPTRSDTNRAVQPCKLARRLKFRLLEVEVCSETESADQLRGYRTADLRLCFANEKKQQHKFSHDAALSITNFITCWLIWLMVFYKIFIRFLTGRVVPIHKMRHFHMWLLVPHLTFIKVYYL